MDINNRSIISYHKGYNHECADSLLKCDVFEGCNYEAYKNNKTTYTYYLHIALFHSNRHRNRTEVLIVCTEPTSAGGDGRKVHTCVVTVPALAVAVRVHVCDVLSTGLQ